MRPHHSRALGALAIVAIAACSTDTAGPTSSDPAATSTTAGKPGDTSVVVPANREWRLATIRGVVMGISRGPGVSDSAQFSQYNVPGSEVAGATIEVHKFTLPSTDLGVVATITSDAAGKFEYVISEPLIVRTGQPSPNTTYRLTITPPAGSPFAKRVAAQVIFLEQYQSMQSIWQYYVFRP